MGPSCFRAYSRPQALRGSENTFGFSIDWKDVKNISPLVEYSNCV